MLLRHGADPNIASPAGTTPLMFAARDNQEALARALIQAGARADTRSPDGLTALDVAIKRKSHAVQYLLEAEKV